jgi:hypothetical protein
VLAVIGSTRLWCRLRRRLAPWRVVAVGRFTVEDNIRELLEHPIRGEQLIKELPLGDAFFRRGFGDPRAECVRVDGRRAVIRELVT